MNTDEDFMDMALEEAGYSLQKGLLPVGAVLVKDGRVISRGRKDGHIHFSLDHAERNALEQLLASGWMKTGGIVVYTTMEPCLMCLGLILTLRLERIVYAIEDPYGGGTGILRPDALPPRHTEKHPFLRGGVRREEAKQLLKRYFTEKAPPGVWTNKENPLVKLCLQ